MTPTQPQTLAARLFEARGADLLRFLRQRLRSNVEALDVAQETYLRFIRLGDPRRIDNPEAYLFRIASNLVFEYKLRERTLAEHVPRLLRSTRLLTWLLADSLASGSSSR